VLSSGEGNSDVGIRPSAIFFYKFQRYHVGPNGERLSQGFPEATFPVSLQFTNLTSFSERSPVISVIVHTSLVFFHLNSVAMIKISHVF
jgi:hypothetical protein